jgi:hypothetical protein
MNRKLKTSSTQARQLGDFSATVSKQASKTLPLGFLSSLRQGSRMELSLMASSMPAMDDPNLWIIDSAASNHITYNADGMTNVRQASTSDDITMGNMQSFERDL